MGAMVDPRAVLEAKARLHGVVRRTDLVAFDGGDPRVELRLKLECQQVGGAFKARGAWNQIAQLSAEERQRGVVAASSGNHGALLAWAAKQAGVAACICMPANSYASKIEAARAHGAEVVLAENRTEAEAECRRRVERGAVEIHPYNAERTLAGAGTAALEILEDWPEVELLVVPVGGGGLLAGSALALAALADRAGAPRGGTVLLGVEPEGAPGMSKALVAGRSVVLERVTSSIQGLTPPYAGELNREIADRLGARMCVLSDAAILAAQAQIVARTGWRLEPAGAAAAAAVFARALPEELFHRAGGPLRVAAILSGGNPDPAQFEAVLAATRSAAGAP